jgi:hypothetical protein
MFADLGARDIATCSVFHLAVPPGHDVLDITARLQARDVVVLGIRRVATPPSTDAEEGRSDPDQAPARSAFGL